MLKAAQHGPRFTISLKRSTQNSSAINKLPADYPIFGWWSQPVAATHWLNRSAGDWRSNIFLASFELARHLVQLGRGVRRKIKALGDVLAQQAIGVFV